MKRTVKGRWARHDIIGRKPKSEFLGADLQQITMDILVTSAHRIKPRKTIDRIAKAVDKGTPFMFVLGGKKIGKKQWVIENSSEAWDKIIEDGKLVSAKMTLTLTEYYED